jgi:hypothetical protein
MSFIRSGWSQEVPLLEQYSAQASQEGEEQTFAVHRHLMQGEDSPTEQGYGRCSQCSCPGFTGSGYTCTRGGCGHHYDSHW